MFRVFFSTSSSALWRMAASLTVAAATLSLAGCGGSSAGTTTTTTTTTTATPTPFTNYGLTGDTSPVHDPAIIRQGSTYYVMSTDPGGQTGNLPIRCSTDKVAWTSCGQVFSSIPQSILNVYPTLTELWAPDISYFNGLYHVYYAASSFGSNNSSIGLATSPTMDPTDPTYGWTDQGVVISSNTSDNYNAIDPNILVDTDASGNPTNVWLDYGSFWGGIYQMQIDPSTGKFLAPSTAATLLATRPAVASDPIEGSSLVQKNGYYYLFASFGYCCETPFTGDTYQIAVGRSASANGPFVDESGTAMTQGGGTILLSGNQTAWDAPGGEDVLIDPTDGDLITFHALNVAQNGLDYLFVNSITWPDNWPQIQP